MTETPKDPFHTNTTAHHLPPHLRPTSSRHHSSSSIKSTSTSRSRYHHQNEFIPTASGIPDLAGGEALEEDDVDPLWGLDGTHQNETSGEEASEEEDWDTIREGSISRRPAWRRPRPQWIYPFIVGAATCLGMSIAPRAELFISLACLAHPPSQPSSVASLVSSYHSVENGQRPIDIPVWLGDSGFGVNATVPPTSPPPAKTPLSAADEWFLKIQHDIYEYERHHHAHPQPQPQVSGHPSSATATRTYALPSGPLPHPTTPGSAEPTLPSSPHRHEEPATEDAPPYRAIDPALCKKDPKVQAAAARLTMVMTFTMGLLSALSAGYWGHTSDRIGRTKIMAIVECGLLLNEVGFILVATFPYLAPGGYRSLLIGPFFEGLLGGFATMGATMHAYVSDTTADGSRATAFAKLGGITMAGFAIGPALGSFVIQATGNIMVPFYINVGLYLLFIPLMIFLLPESLSTEARQHLVKTAKLAKEAAKRRDVAEREWEDEEDEPADAGASGWSRVSTTGNSRRSKRFRGNAKRGIKRLFGFLQPLATFLPRERDDGRSGKDWNLTSIGSALFFISMLIGVYTLKGQYTFYSYGWTAAQLGPYMSLVGFSRGFMLIVVVPTILKKVKPRYAQVEPSNGNPAVTDVGTSSSAEPERDNTPKEPTTSQSNVRSAQLDLMVARISLAIECIGYICLSFGPPPLLFVAFTTFATFGSAAAPATKSLALSLLPSKREAGRLFGALSVADALGATLLGPLMFGTLFSTTVGWYAPTIFILAAAILAIALLSLSFVRLGEPGEGDGGELGRGRSKKVRKVKSGLQAQ